MEEKVYTQTKFDSMVTNRNMQLVKAVLPYINSPLCNYLGFIIKYQELINVLNINLNNNCDVSLKDKHMSDNSSLNIFNVIKDYLNEDEKEFIDSIYSMFEIIQLFGNLSNPDDITNMDINILNNLGNITGMGSDIFNNLGNITGMDTNMNDNIDKDMFQNTTNNTAENQADI